MGGWIKPRVPARIRGPLSAVYWWWVNRGRHQEAALGSLERRRSVAALGELRDLHRGQRCFVLGNGPSLKATDLTRLKGEVTFGMNRIYLAFGDMGFPTTYYLAVNTLVIEQCAAEIRSLPMRKFLTWRGRRWLAGAPDVIYLDT